MNRETGGRQNSDPPLADVWVTVAPGVLWQPITFQYLDVWDNERPSLRANYIRSFCSGGTAEELRRTALRLNRGNGAEWDVRYVYNLLGCRGYPVTLIDGDYRLWAVNPRGTLVGADGRPRPGRFGTDDRARIQNPDALGLATDADRRPSRSRAREANGRRYWAFLANPDTYQIEEALRELDVDTWTTGTADVRAGDRVAIWKAQGRNSRRRGVLALGDVLTDPEPISTDASPFWLDRRLAETAENRAWVRYVVPPGLPLWLDELNDPIIAALSVARGQGRKPYIIEDDQWAALLAAAGGWPEEASEVRAARDGILQLAGKTVPLKQAQTPDPEARRVVELYAMSEGKKFCASQGWDWSDVTPLRLPYDIIATRSDGTELRIEVKGTISTGGAVILTPNEVRHARAMGSHDVALLVVSRIVLSRDTAGELRASGGSPRIIHPWLLREEDLSALGWEYRVPES